MRKPIKTEHCIETGYVKKTHGVQGGLHLVLENNLDEILDQLDFLFFQIDGLPVPFFIQEITGLGSGFANVEFKTITSKEQAQRYIGSKLMIDKDDLIDDADTISPSFLKGFVLIDDKIGKIGEIVEVNDFGGNIVFSVTLKNSEVLVPFNEELLIAFDTKNATITLNCPEGLFDTLD